jgi:hypothetical protein
MKCRREWNSFQHGIDKRGFSEGCIFTRSNIKEDMKGGVKIFYTNE